MSDQRPIRDQHAWLETRWRRTFLIRDRHALPETHQRPTCLSRDPSEMYMPDHRPSCLIRDQNTWWRPIGDWHAWSETHWTCLIKYFGLRLVLIRHVGIWSDMLVFDQACWYLIRHVGIWSGRLVSNYAWWSLMGIWSGMLASDGSPMGFQWIFDWSPIGLQ